MSTAPAAPAADTEETQIVPSRKRNWKKLLVLGAALLVAVSLVIGGRVYWLHKKRAAEELAEEYEEGASEEAYVDKKERKPPVFLALDMFTVNLADRDADRFAQIGITLEVDDAKIAEDMRVYMPAIRNNILMVLAQKTSTDLLEKEGKVKLAAQIRREAARGFGIYVGEDDAAAKPMAGAEAEPKPTAVVADSAKAVAGAVSDSAPAASAASGGAHSASEAAGKSASGATAAASGAKPDSTPPAKKPKLKRPEEHNPIVRVHFSNFIIQ